jgi:hypothetical protein
MDRRPLTVGINSVPGADPEEIRRFVKGDLPTPGTRSTELQETKLPQAPAPLIEPSRRRHRARPSGVTPVGLIPVTVRLRPELAGALKRASLERQLAGEQSFTQQELVEQALEPWLRDHGYLL